MPQVAKNLLNKRFGTLVIIALAPPDSTSKNPTQWKCLCDCGRIIITKANRLLTGNTITCGDKKAHPLKHGATQLNGFRTPEYMAWQNMKARCLYPRHNSYKNYGGRGITVCNEWLNDFIEFFKHIGPRPSSKYSIDRIDNNGNYEPGNVRWATRKEQNANRRQL